MPTLVQMCMQGGNGDQAAARPSSKAIIPPAGAKNMAAMAQHDIRVAYAAAGLQEAAEMAAADIQAASTVPAADTQPAQVAEQQR